MSGKSNPVPVLEVCCGSLDAAHAAVEGGAGRIELCAALSLDGLTPSIGLVSELRDTFPTLKIHVLIRPHEGGFVYTEPEIRVMERDIHAAVQAGATAIVSGALTADGQIDAVVTRRLVEAAAPLPFTFHRAFDRVADKAAALRTLHSLGVRRVLTSGGAATAEAGIPALRSLVELAGKLNADSPAASSISILPGGGVNSSNAARIIRETGATEIHGSCSVALPGVSRQTSAAEVRAVINVL